MPSIPESKRFNAWFAMMICSAVTLGAVVDNSNKVNKTTNENWLVSACAICLSFSAIMVITHFVGSLSSMCIGKKPEGIVTLICAVIWSVATASITKAENNLAFAGPVIINANLYFFGWAGLISVIYLLGSYLDETRMIDAAAIQGSVTSTPRMVHWLGLIAASVIVFASAADEHGTVCNGQNLGTLYSNPCAKNNYAISFGVIGCFFSIVAVVGKVMGRITVTIEALISAMLFTFYCLGVAVVTGVGGPGSLVGNLFFATWAGFYFTILLTMSSVKEIVYGGANTGGVEEETPEESSDPEAPVEAEDDV